MPAPYRTPPAGPASHSALRRAAGFTMVELIVVIVLVGILGAVAGNRFFNRSAYEMPSTADQARTMLRYAQKLAIARNAPVFVHFELNRMSLCHVNPIGGCPTAQRVAMPGSFTGGDEATRTQCGTVNWYCLGRPPAIAGNLSPLIDWMSFDGLGRPTLEGGVAGGIVMTFSASGVSGSQTVTVSEEIGYVR